MSEPRKGENARTRDDDQLAASGKSRRDPATGIDETSGDEGIDSPVNPNNDPHGARSARQQQQNEDQNDRFDPSEGKRPDQRRRNDKQGQMGG